MKLRTISSVILLLCCSGCRAVPSANLSSTRFTVTVREESVLGVIATVYDRKTGACFLWMKVGYGAGLAPAPVEVCR